MSDTGGRATYDPLIKKTIKTVLDSIDIRPRRSRAKGSPKQKNTKPRNVDNGDVLPPYRPEPRTEDGRPGTDVPGSVIVDQIPRVVWSTLKNRGVLRQAFGSEIIAYLKLLAEFVEVSASGGLEAVEKRFDVEAESGFSRLQRIIRQQVESKAPSAFAGPAKRSFNTGSINWAKKIVHVTDPLKIKVGKLVAAVAVNPDQSLIGSPTSILREYGRRLLEGALPGGDSNRRVVDQALKTFDSQFAAFMSDHNNPDEWRSDTLAVTVAEFEKLLTIAK